MPWSAGREAGRRSGRRRRLGTGRGRRALLLRLDGQAVTGQDLEQLRGHLSGERGSQVTLEVEQGAGEQAKALVREPFVERVVSGAWLDEDVLLVTSVSLAFRLSPFGPMTDAGNSG